MPRFVHLAVMALAVLLVPLAASAEQPGLRLRTVDGVEIDISEHSHAEPTILLTFSTHDPAATSTLRKAQKSLRKQGVRMVAVNVDGAQERTALKAWVRRSKLKAPVFADPDSTLRSYLAANGPTTIVVGPEGRVVERWPGWDKTVEAKALATVAALPAPQMLEMAEKTPLVEADDWTPPVDTLGGGDDSGSGEDDSDSGDDDSGSGDDDADDD